MSLERAMTRLSLRPASISRQCRRAFTSPAKPRQQQSAVGAIAGWSTHVLELQRYTDNASKKLSNLLAPQHHLLNLNTRRPPPHQPSPRCLPRTLSDSPTRPWPPSQSRTTARKWKSKRVLLRAAPIAKDWSRSRSDVGTWEMYMLLTT
jgi:hypothetical protein